MGQKIHPIALRLQHSNRYFDSCWYSDFYYTEILSQDIQIRQYINSILKQIQYPSGRLFIQKSIKKTKVILFFCSPLYSRNKRSEFFDIRQYRNPIQSLLKNPKKTRKNQELLYTENKNHYEVTQKIKFLKKRFQILYFLLLYYNSYFYSGISTTTEQRQNLFSFNFYKEKISHIKNELFFVQSHKENRYKIQGESENWILDASVSKMRSSQRLHRFDHKVMTATIEDTIKQVSATYIFNADQSNATQQVSKILCSRYLLHIFSIPFGQRSRPKLSKIPMKKDSKFYVMNTVPEKRLFTEHIENTLVKFFRKEGITTGQIQFYTFKSTEDYKSARFLADEVVFFLEQKVPFRRIKNRIYIEIKKKSFIKGVRISCSGRVGGRSKKAQRSRTDLFKYGETSLHVFSSKIDFASSTAYTPFGSIGIKVWICFN